MIESSFSMVARVFSDMPSGQRRASALFHQLTQVGRGRFPLGTSSRGYSYFSSSRLKLQRLAIATVSASSSRWIQARNFRLAPQMPLAVLEAAASPLPRAARCDEWR